MPLFPPADIATWTDPQIPPQPNLRPLSIWEITSWILPMAPEHFRRVLAATPHLPQGSAGAEGGTRWFTAADLIPLRAHFAAAGRKARYQPQYALRAPLVALTGPMGAMGRSTALLHLAVGTALSGRENPKYYPHDFRQHQRPVFLAALLNSNDNQRFDFHEGATVRGGRAACVGNC